MYDWETPFLITLAVLMSPFVVILLAIFCLIVDAVIFAVSSFIHDVRSQCNSKED